MTVEKRTIRSDIPGSESYDQVGSGDMQKLTVGVGISLNGEITSCEHLVVEGEVKASLKDARRVDIMHSGQVKGEIQVENAEISGYFEGDLTVYGCLIIRASACVVGNVNYGSLRVEPGAKIIGTMSVLQADEMVVSQPEERVEHIQQDNRHSVTPLYEDEETAGVVDETNLKAFAG